MSLSRFSNDIDWNVYKNQQDVSKEIPTNEFKNTFIQPKQKSLSESISDYLPKMPHGLNIATGMMSLAFPHEQAELVKNLPQVLAGTKPGISEKTEQFVGELLPGIEGGGKGGIEASYKGIKKGAEYINPEKITEQLRGEFGKGTISENIGELGERLKFGKESSQKEALVPKQELMKEISGKNIFRYGSENKDIYDVAKLFEKDVEHITEGELKDFQKAVNQYYKDSDIDKLAENAGQIFHKHLNEGQIAQLEKLLPPLEKLRPSQYLKESEIEKFYSKKGVLYQAEKNFIKNKTPENADTLMSKIKSEIRDLEWKKEQHGLSDIEGEKLPMLKSSLSALESDFNNFLKTLPKELQGKYKEFATKYAIGVGPYEDIGLINQLAKGKFEGITPAMINKLFSNPNPSKELKKIIKDIGPSGWNNIVYNMLSNFPPGDVKSMTKVIKEGYRKGSPIITEDMLKLANQAEKRALIGSLVKSTIGASAGGILGGGPLGMAVGAASPYLWANRDLLSKILSKLKK